MQPTAGPLWIKDQGKIMMDEMKTTRPPASRRSSYFH
jgi:hypothetical protein